MDKAPLLQAAIAIHEQAEEIISSGMQLPLTEVMEAQRLLSEAAAKLEDYPWFDVGEVSVYLDSTV